MIPPDVQSDVEILPATLKFTVRGRNQGKNSATPRQNPWNPHDLGSKPKNPQGKVGSRLFSTWPSACQSIKKDQEVRKAMFFTAAEVW